MINRKQNIPQGWRIDLLENLADRGSGHTPDKNESGYWNGGIKWVSLADSWRLDNLFISETDKEISILGLQNSSAVLHPPDTVILSRDAGVGKSAILKSEMAVSQHFIAWRCQPKNKLNYLFFYYWLQLRKEEFERVAVGSTIKTIGLPYFKKLKIVYPPLAEQKKIAEIINCWDNAIAITEKLITTKRRLKQGLMQKLLTGKVRFSKFKNSIWKTVKLGKIVEINPSTQVKLNPNEFITFLSMSDLQEKGGIATSQKRILKDVGQGYTSFQEADILVAKITPCFENNKGAIASNLENSIGFGSTEFHVLRCNKQIKPEFLYQITFSHEFRKKGAASMTGSAGQKRIPTTFLKNYEIPIPSIEEQNCICFALEAIDHEIKSLNKFQRLIQTQKQGLMQQLLTGKIRVQTP